MSAPQPFPSLPPGVRGPVVDGFRWTLGLAAAGLPLGLAVRVLLARAGPTVFGAFAVLLLYINFTASLLFFGGNAVAIRFLPALPPERRRGFLARYAALVLAALLPWEAWATLWPRQLPVLFGNLAAPGLERWLIWLAPLPIGFWFLISALKGLLAIKPAQIVARAVNAAAFLGFCLLGLAAGDVLRAHCAALLWGLYLAATAGGAALAWRLLSPRLPRVHAGAERNLPAEFWKFTLGLQANSALTFFSRQLDVIVILGLGGTARLGIYFAWLTAILFAPTVLEVVLDALLPALTNAWARSNLAAVAELTATVGRIILFASLAATLALWLFPAPIAALFGPAYGAVARWLRWGAPLAVLLAASHLAGTLLSAAGQPQRLIAAHAVRIAAFAAGFALLWPAHGLAGAVLAAIAGEAAYHAVAIAQLRRLPPLSPALRRAYGALAAAVAAGGAAAAGLAHAPASARALAGGVVLAGFWIAGGYSRRELGAWLALLPGVAPPANAWRRAARLESR